MENAILVVGSVALDSVSTPSGEGRENLGGSAVYFSLAASLFSPISVVAVVGDDFPQEHHDLLRGRADVTGLKTLPGKTFRWAGRYGQDLSSAETLDTQLNVFAHFRPSLEDHHRRTPYLFLANIDPELQFEVLAQVERPRLTACDTMNYWIDSKRPALKELLGRVDIFFVNEAEARSLSGNTNTLAAARTLASWGPSVVVVKKGENGCLLFAHGQAYPIPAFPVQTVTDPTGAGDSFAGGFLGYLAGRGADLRDASALRGAAMVGSVIASFGIEAFGTRRFESLSIEEVKARCEAFALLVQADPVFENCLVFPA